MKKFLEKIIEYSKNYDAKMKKNKSKEKFKMPILKLFFSPFTMIMDNLKNASIVVLMSSVVLTLLAIFMGYSVLCASPSAAAAGLRCSSFGFLYLFYIIAKLMIISIFITFFYDLISGREFSVKNLFVLNLRHLKTFGVLIVFILLNFFPLLSLYALYIRVPNPEWKIEIIYFAFVSIGFIIPFFVMRFYSVFGYFVEKEKVVELLPVWEKTKDNGFKIVSSVFIIIIFSMFILISFYSNFRGFSPEHVIYSAFVSEFIYNILQLIIVALFVGNFYIQRVILIEDSGDE